ncbi:hypothetical protein AGMMS50229_07360 [Campylobacterota bacterium]|nr:hypothetical protein AGMMS50229_07360 [Campylobacterota bacterium]
MLERISISLPPLAKQCAVVLRVKTISAIIDNLRSAGSGAKEQTNELLREAFEEGLKNVG